MSKGSRPRPYSVNQKTFDENWNKIFKNKDNTPTIPNKEQSQTNNQPRNNDGSRES